MKRKLQIFTKLYINVCHEHSEGDDGNGNDKKDKMLLVHSFKAKYEHMYDTRRINAYQNRHDSQNNKSH